MNMGLVFKYCLYGMIAAMLALQGCVSATTPKSKTMTRSPVKASYPKLAGYTLELTAVVPGIPFAPDEVASINFKLKNAGAKPVLIDEWYMNEADNIRLYYREYLPGADLENFDRKAWTCITHELKPPVRRFPLIINPNNIVFVEKRIAWGAALGAANRLRKDGKFWIIAELALNSVDVRSPPFAIELKAP